MSEDRMLQDMNEIFEKIPAQFDQFVSLNMKLDLELDSLRNRIDRLESQLRQVFLHLNLQPVN